MPEEQQSSEASVTMPPSNPNPNPNPEPPSNEATIESHAQGAAGVESTCNNDAGNGGGGETSVVTSEGEKKGLELADELMEKGSKAVKDDDLNEALDCFSRTLEIRVAHYGELAPECVSAYYKYGCALLYKAQDEADPLVAVPKKGGGSQQDSDKGDSVKKATNCESSVTSVASNAGQVEGSGRQEGTGDAATSGNDEEEDGEDPDDDDGDEELNEADEEESDLDTAWKMLDIARVIVEKHSGDTKEKVDILSKLAEVSMEREEFETAQADYEKALSILEQVAEPDYRHLAEINFRICLCHELGSNAQEAILYCKKATSVCKSRLDQLKSEVINIPEPALSSNVEELDKGVQQSATLSHTDDLVEKRKKEIETLAALSIDLERKLEDLQQLASNPKPILSEILGITSVKAKGNENRATAAAISSSQMAAANSSGSFDSPTASTAHTNGASAVTHLGVVGRGVKRMHMNSGTDSSGAVKKPALDSDKDDGNAA